MNKKYETFSFCRGDYTEPGSNEVNEYRLYEDINEFVKLAIKNCYQMKIYDDSYTIIVEYNYFDESLSGVSLEWLGEDEYVANAKEEEEDE